MICSTVRWFSKCLNQQHQQRLGTYLKCAFSPPTPHLLNQKNSLCFGKPSSDSHALLSSLGTTALKIFVTERATSCVRPPVQFLTWHTCVTATSWHPEFLCELWGTEEVFISFWNKAAQSLGSFPSVAYCFPFFHWWKVLPPGGSYAPCSV